MATGEYRALRQMPDHIDTRDCLWWRPFCRFPLPVFFLGEITLWESDADISMSIAHVLKGLDAFDVAEGRTKMFEVGARRTERLVVIQKTAFRPIKDGLPVEVSFKCFTAVFDVFPNLRVEALEVSTTGINHVDKAIYDGLRQDRPGLREIDIN